MGVRAGLSMKNVKWPSIHLKERFFFYGACSPIVGYGLLILEVFRDHTQRRTTVGRTPLDEWSARRRDLYLTTHNTHNRQTSMPPVGFEPTISAGERPQTYALDRAATGTGFERKILRRIWGPVKENDKWRISYNNEWCNLCDDPCISGVVKLTRLQWAGLIQRADSKGVPRRILYVHYSRWQKTCRQA